MLEDSTNKGQVKEGKMGYISFRKRVKKVEKTSFFFLETPPPPPPPTHTHNLHHLGVIFNPLIIPSL